MVEKCRREWMRSGLDDGRVMAEAKWRRRWKEVGRVGDMKVVGVARLLMRAMRQAGWP